MVSTDLENVYVTILAGGSGTRLWPLSRRARPKQLLNLVGERSLLQRTVDRVLPLVACERVYILTGPDHAPLIREQLPEVPQENILIEPEPRGTAPCLGLAAMKLHRAHPDGVVMVSLHADHCVGREERFRDALRSAIALARGGHLVTIGIVPSGPETGFGYIERGQSLGKASGLEGYRVVRFTEKPPLEQAREFVASGRYYWNTGYFVWSTRDILGEFRRLLPEMHKQLETIVAAADTSWAPEVLERVWRAVKPVTIDVGIMERASDVVVIPCDLGWNDVGSWASLCDILAHDAEDNVVLGSGQHVGLDTVNSLIYSEGRLVATIGLEEMIVVDTGDALLVLPKSRAQDVGALVKRLRAKGFTGYL